jgi:hypothetical protein
VPYAPTIDALCAANANSCSSYWVVGSGSGANARGEGEGGEGGGGATCGAGDVFCDDALREEGWMDRISGCGRRLLVSI